MYVFRQVLKSFCLGYHSAHHEFERFYLLIPATYIVVLRRYSGFVLKHDFEIGFGNIRFGFSRAKKMGFLPNLWVQRWRENDSMGIHQIRNKHSL